LSFFCFVRVPPPPPTRTSAGSRARGESSRDLRRASRPPSASSASARAAGGPATRSRPRLSRERPLDPAQHPRAASTLADPSSGDATQRAPMRRVSAALVWSRCQRGQERFVESRLTSSSDRDGSMIVPPHLLDRVRSRSSAKNTGARSASLVRATPIANRSAVVEPAVRVLRRDVRELAFM